MKKKKIINKTLQIVFFIGVLCFAMFSLSSNDKISAASWEDVYPEYSGHAISLVSTVPPTCTEDGYEHYECKNCTIKFDLILPAIGHAWNLGEITKEPTCLEDGVKTFTCGNCKETYTEGITATGHEFTSKVEPATTKKEELTIYTCKNCGYTYSKVTGAKLKEAAKPKKKKKKVAVTTARNTEKTTTAIQNSTEKIIQKTETKKTEKTTEKKKIIAALNSPSDGGKSQGASLMQMVLRSLCALLTGGFILTIGSDVKLLHWYRSQCKH